jgi:hypothetical protein
MSDETYVVSDILYDVRRWFLERGKGGLTLSAEEVATFGEIFRHLGDRSRLMAHEITRQRWNLTSGEDSAGYRKLLEELKKPDTNVRLASFAFAPSKGSA